jgi:hypothetical protein
MDPCAIIYFKVRIRNQHLVTFLTHGSAILKIRTGIRDEHPGLYFRELRNIILG